jgi:hypothetical protein
MHIVVAQINMDAMKIEKQDITIVIMERSAKVAVNKICKFLVGDTCKMAGKPNRISLANTSPPQYDVWIDL